MPERTRLPDDREGKTKKFTIYPEGGQSEPFDFYITYACYPDGRLGEVFFKGAKMGSLASGALDAVMIAMSVGLQYGVPVEAYANKFIAMKFDPAGPTGEPRFKWALSVLDVVGRWLKAEFCTKEEETHAPELH